MFSELLYNTPPALNPAEFHRRLYEANVRPELLDRIGHEYQYHPSIFVRALHEGHPIHWVNRVRDGNSAVSPETEAEVGDIHLLVFAEVALHRFEELRYDHSEQLIAEAREFLGSIAADGFHYENGRIFGREGLPITPVPLTGSTTISPQPAKRAEPNIDVDPNPPAGATQKTASWTRGEKIAAWTLVVALVAAIAGWFVVPEFRSWLHLDKNYGTENHSQQNQDISIAGTVVDADNNQPVPQAQVTISGRTEAYVTEDNGNFRLHFSANRSDIGDLRIRVTKNGYRVYDQTVTPPTNNLIIPLRKK